MDSSSTPSAKLYKKDTESFKDVFSFAGTLPERVNGRIAMIGFAGGAVAEFATHKSILEQAAYAPVTVTIAALAIALGSIMPKFVTGVSLQDMYASAETSEALGGGFTGFFTAPLELWTGRVAMLGFAGLVAVEILLKNGGALF